MIFVEQKELNQSIAKWGVSVVEIELIVNSIVKDESGESGEDPALKTISTVFKSIFGGSGSGGGGGDESSAGKADTSEPNATTNFLKLLQSMSPILVPGEDGRAPDFGSLIAGLSAPSASSSSSTAGAATTSAASATDRESSSSSNSSSAFKLIKMIQPLLNEQLVSDVQTVYEFHIRCDSAPGGGGGSAHYESYYLDLKNVPCGQVGKGHSLFSKADCVIRTSERDLNELLTDQLKPFTAYMSGRIEIDGDLQDVFKLKKIIKTIAPSA